MVKTVTQEEVTQEDLGGANPHTTLSGVAHEGFENDLEALRATRDVMGFLPLNNRGEESAGVAMRQRGVGFWGGVASCSGVRFIAVTSGLVGV